MSPCRYISLSRGKSHEEKGLFLFREKGLHFCKSNKALQTMGKKYQACISEDEILIKFLFLVCNEL